MWAELGDILMEVQNHNAKGDKVLNPESGKLAAISADKILSGTQAGNIPVATSAMSLRINYDQAQKLGLTVPKSLLSMATEIIH
jgi:ABC-type uncharacterized transport system substrate-binding protein